MIEPAELELDPVVLKLRALYGGAILAAQSFREELTLLIAPESLRRVAEFLQGDSELQFDFLSDIAAVDRFPSEPRFELNYQLVSLQRRCSLRLRVTVSGGIDPQIETLTAVWPAANWMEREIFDLFGVRFAGHPDLRRILMPENWEGHPLRKDFPVEGYR